MKKLYSNLAWTGIQKNRKLYLPYILTCIGMVMIFYIITFLYESPFVDGLYGGSNIKFCMSLGRLVMGVFSCIFLFYTNSFLTRRRKKEFGLYNILGMGKPNIARILFHEALTVAVISLGTGLFSGVVLSKLMELLLLRLVRAEVSYQVLIVKDAVIQTLILFGVIYTLLFLNMLRQLYFSNPIALLHSENTGEKPPKANWLFAIVGAVSLGVAYYMAVSIDDPIDALIWFFVAVILVILGTYLLFVAGSVVICRLLQKNKRYYYNPKHFVSVSSMAYRMKRNGAGLASICILSTMVLVMLSSTACMNIGVEDSLRSNYPRNIEVDLELENLDAMSEESASGFRQVVEQAVEESGISSMNNVLEYRAALVAGTVMGDRIQTDVRMLEETFDAFNIWQVFIIPLEDYNRLTGAEETLEAGEVLIYTTKRSYRENTVTIECGQVGTQTLQVKKVVTEFIDNGIDAIQIFPSIFLFVDDFNAYVGQMDGFADFNGNRMVELAWSYGFDTEVEDEVQVQSLSKIIEALKDKREQGDSGILHYTARGIAQGRSSSYMLFGGLFFLALILGSVFLCATVLMIYYKQIAEGFEDQSRFEIMRKVGMTKTDIRRNIDSQILTVFYLPLVMAGIHLLFAFPFIQKILMLFASTNERLLICVTVICYVVFAAFYSLVYRITSNAYYAIVSK